MYVWKSRGDELEIEPSPSKEAVFLESTASVEQIALHDDEQFDGINKVLQDSRLQGATTTISIRRASDGELLYENNGDVRVRPASVMKLFTAATALERLGSDHVFKTAVYTDGKIEDGILHGDIYLVGQGDPTLTQEDLNTLAQMVKEKGVHTINGNIYGDDTWYDNVRLSQDLNWSDEPYYTGAQISALTFSPNEDYDAGTVIVEVYPGAKAGEQASIGLVPKNDYVHIMNETKTVQKKGDKSLTAERIHGTNTIVVKGTIPVGGQKTRIWASVWEPTIYTVHLFKNTLEKQGIQLPTVYKVERKTRPKETFQLAENSSIPLEELLVPFMKLSNNGHGEVLVKEMGKVIGEEGSWDKGLVVMNDTLNEIGLETNTMLFRDGSGMSHKTLVTTNEVTRLLYVAQEKSWYPTFLESLPIAGYDERFQGGTLRYRMSNTVATGKVRAKTGTLNGVTSLAGYVEKSDGDDLIFSIIINNHLDDSTYDVIDQIVVMLAGDEVN
ncbi:D-alanyl-D-alanine carboxypeptidase/D-alanyl-D-alanine-endopeptidase [Sporosarcina ureilytica]|uniref:D-alanyl-D-alanine carboxypeptidase/D-alanyl-D-alanine-endopeptidase n=2 Tax=Sporosarcina ureilytica TaxID=298596 RepID=A0A1D8JJY7_9BACL|nr:D-alanyl-D-alanine carboxypeptidase/D-alanyl-D-alanine-endopeptidase [Sporosarcina ureilytica]